MKIDIDQAKQDAKALARALKELGIADLSPTDAQHAFARTKNFPSWKALINSGGVGAWNAAQVAIYRGDTSYDLLGIEEGEDYSDCGDGLFIAMMNEAGSQPLSRVIKTLDHWANAVDAILEQMLQAQKQGTPFGASTVRIPGHLPDAVRSFLKSEITSSNVNGGWEEALSHAEGVRRDLYDANMALRHLRDGTQDEILLLEGYAGDLSEAIAVRVPSTMSMEAAIKTAEEIFDQLQQREEMVDGAVATTQAFDYGTSEFKVRLSRAGLIPLRDTGGTSGWY